MGVGVEEVMLSMNMQNFKLIINHAIPADVETSNLHTNYGHGPIIDLSKLKIRTASEAIRSSLHINGFISQFSPSSWGDPMRRTGHYKTQALTNRFLRRIFFLAQA